MIINYVYPIEGVTDLSAQLFLEGVAVGTPVIMTALVINSQPAGYTADFVGVNDGDADEVQVSSVSQGFGEPLSLSQAATVDLSGIATTQNVTDSTTEITDAIDGIRTVDLGDMPAQINTISGRFAAQPPGPVLLVPAPTQADISVIYVYTRTEAGLTDGIDVEMLLLDPAPVVVAGSYQCYYKIKKYSGAKDGEFPNRVPVKGLTAFQCYPGKRYRLRSDGGRFDRIVTAPPAGISKNLFGL